MKKVFLTFLFILCLVFAVACGNQSTVQQPTQEKQESQESQQASNPQEQKSNYPEKQITLVVPYAPGGASDMVARTVAQVVEKELDIPIVVMNKTGGTGAVGMSFVEASPKDGYTFGYVPVEMTMVKSLGYADIEPDKFDLLGRAIVIPAAITVPANAPYDTIEEFVEYAKNNPGDLKVGNSGTGSIWHIAAAGFANAANIELSYIPFDGAAPAVAALMGRHIDAVSVSPSEVKSGVDGGDLKVLAVMSADRDKLFPDVPSLKEKGIDVEIAAWGGFAVPKDTPDDIKKILEEAVQVAVSSDEFKKLAEERGLNQAYLSASEFSEFALSQYNFYNELIPSMELK